MPYLYFGKRSLYKGKPLFKILCNLKNFGCGRIVYRTIDYYDYPGEISFFRILLAQPEMDEKTLEGRVVAERVFRGRRFKEPVNLSKKAHKPDFRLVPRDEEAEFCQWDKVLDYEPSRDAPFKAKFMEMPPLLKKVMMSRGKTHSEDLLLPAYKIYEGDVNPRTDIVQSNDMAQYLSEEYSDYKDFDMSQLPEGWVMERYNRAVGRKRWSGFVEGNTWDTGWVEQKRRIDEEQDLRERLRKLKGKADT